jgi:hypothetical protein
VQVLRKFANADSRRRDLLIKGIKGDGPSFAIFGFLKEDLYIGHGYLIAIGAGCHCICRCWLVEMIASIVKRD